MFEKINQPSNNREDIKMRVSSEIQSITSSSISLENIYSFYDGAVDKLINIVAIAVDAYKRENPNNNLSGKELEDAALTYLGSSDVGSILDAISERRTNMKVLEQEVADRIHLSPEIFVPPTQGEEHLITGSGKGLEEKKLIPRLLTLIYILENDLNIYLENSDSEEVIENSINIVRGTVADTMMRKHPYFRVSIPELSRVVYICEEEGNATFVFNDAEIESIGMKIEDMDTMEKSEYDTLIESNPGLGIRIIQTNSWREDILTALTEDILRLETKVGTTHEASPSKKVKSDFTSIEDISKKKDGWESTSSLMSTCKSAYNTIKKYADTFKELHLEWFEVQMTGSKKAEHYSPELVKLIIEHFNEIPEKKEGWESASSLQKICKSSPDTIKKYADTFRELHLEWFEVQKTTKAKAEHYSPELVKLIIEHFKEIPKKKAGWESANSMQKICKNNGRTIKKYADTFRESNLEWFDVQKTGARTAEHYSPELVKLIIEHFNEVPKKKDGWKSARSLQKICKSNAPTIKKYADTFRESNLEWFEVQKTGAQTAEHYSPELVKLIIEHFNEVPRKKVGWENARSLQKICKSSTDTIKKYADTFRESNPEWFEMQKTGARTAEHYSPELVEKIIEHFVIKHNLVK